MEHLVSMKNCWRNQEVKDYWPSSGQDYFGLHQGLRKNLSLARNLRVTPIEGHFSSALSLRFIKWPGLS